MPAIRRRTAALLLLAGCGPLSTPPPGGWASLPPDAVLGAGDPTIAAISAGLVLLAIVALVIGDRLVGLRKLADF